MVRVYSPDSISSGVLWRQFWRNYLSGFIIGACTETKLLMYPVLIQCYKRYIQYNLRKTWRIFPFATKYMFFVRSNDTVVQLLPVGPYKIKKREMCEEYPCSHENVSEKSFTSTPADIFMTWCLNKRYIFRGQGYVMSLTRYSFCIRGFAYRKCTN